MALHSPHKYKHNRSKSIPSSPKGHQSLTGTLVVEVERLEESCSFSSSIGADWFGQALEVAINCYSNLSNMQIDMEGVGSKWINAHLDDILHLLETCNLLRDSITEIRKQHTSVQVAIRGLGRDLTPSAHTLERALTAFAIWLSKKKDTHTQLENCMSTLRRMAEKLKIEDKAGLAQAAININHAKAITVMIFSALVTALSFKTSHMRMASLPLPAHFTCLQHKLREALKTRKRSSSSSSRSLRELQAADIALGDLNNLLNSRSKLQLPLHLSPSTLALNDLETALPQLEHTINQLFNSLISARFAVLNNLSSQ
ncbi:protein BPS1, chloroplastic-like [Cryptomeria japonica]|uniref:protein BPS1, chloroplastic-like n=1 Tax=Cryptomeria japonica TaxID=3369 RepID=UPI0027DA2F2A|nr:protein BPS1, chloroplastic-like [Cryptomeria japonica]